MLWGMGDFYGQIENPRSPPTLQFFTLNDGQVTETAGGAVIQGGRERPRPEQGGGTPAVALTVYARPEDRVRPLTAGFQGHVTNPSSRTSC